MKERGRALMLTRGSLCLRSAITRGMSAADSPGDNWLSSFALGWPVFPSWTRRAAAPLLSLLLARLLLAALTLLPLPLAEGGNEGISLQIN